MGHSCFIRNGVTKMTKLGIDLMTELTRLHTLHIKNEFDWRTTTTLLTWMNNMRERNRDGARAVAVSFVKRADEAGWDTASQTELESQAACEDCRAPATTSATCGPGYGWVIGQGRCVADGAVESGWVGRHAVGAKGGVRGRARSRDCRTSTWSR